MEFRLERVPSSRLLPPTAYTKLSITATPGREGGREEEREREGGREGGREMREHHPYYMSVLMNLFVWVCSYFVVHFQLV